MITLGRTVMKNQARLKEFSGWQFVSVPLMVAFFCLALLAVRKTEYVQARRP